MRGAFGNTQDFGLDRMGGLERARVMTKRNVAFAVIGAAALVLKGAYSGPLQEVVHSYGGNFSVSFALYFACVNATRDYRRPRLVASLITLAAVTSFELTNGFGFMANVYDPIDLVANAAGVGFAVLVDLLSGRFIRSRHDDSPAVTEPAHPADGQER